MRAVSSASAGRCFGRRPGPEGAIRVPPQGHGHRHQPDRYGPGTAFATGLIHGIGAETGAQVLVIAAVGGAAGQGSGQATPHAFVAGLLLSSPAVAVLASAGYTSSARFRTLYVGAGVLASVFGLRAGAAALLGMADRLPGQQTPIAARFGRAGASRRWPPGANAGPRGKESDRALGGADRRCVSGGR